MRSPVRIIEKKRDGKELEAQEIEDFIRGLESEDVADYQATAFLMAVYFKGMTLKETVALTRAMLESGEQYDLGFLEKPVADKHSTGGVGDKVSLILSPLAAACGLAVPMMSGRGLGHTGGTLDKLESIEGFRTDLSKDEFFEVLKSCSCAMIGQSESIVPADRKLYALRDVTGTVESIPLIVASILSKKLAEGTKALVLDVKAGSGAFIKSRPEARKLARMLKEVAKRLGLPCQAVLSNMDQPLGYAVGNSLELIESVEVLKGEKDPNADLSSCDLKEITVQLCSNMLVLSKLCRTATEARKRTHQKLSDGSAYEVFLKMVKAQGGSLGQIENIKSFPLSPLKVQWKAKKRGYLTKIDTHWIGRILVEMGGGRKRVEDEIDHGVGLVFHKKLGSKLKSGDPIATVYAPSHIPLDRLEEMFHGALTIGPSRKPVPKLILDPNVK